MSDVPATTDVVLLYQAIDEQWIKTHLVPLFAERASTPELCLWSDKLSRLFAREQKIICFLADEPLRSLVQQAKEKQWQLALLPHPDMKHARYGFGISGDLAEALDDALGRPVAPLDLMMCNDTPVFNSVVIGDTFSLIPGEALAERFASRLRRFFRLLSRIGQVTFSPFKMTTQKGKLLDTAALGIVAVEHGRSSVLSRRLVPDSSANDGMLHALVLVPRSVFEMLRFLFAALFLRDYWNKGTPSFVGHIKTSCLTIQSSKVFNYTHDGLIERTNDLKLEVEPRCLYMVPGRHLTTEDSLPEQKEVFKTQALPAGKAKSELVTYPLPWIHHAATEEFKDLFIALRESAKATPSYLTLMLLATLLATFGLFANSTPVIIGAMILAPLMGPIVSMALGTLRQDEGLMIASARSIGIGTALSIACAVLATWLIPLQTVNSEIAARISPTLLDLGVAVVSGVAGAYAHARAEVAKSLAGVAIAVALVPPLAVAGIGLGWGDFTVFWGAFLLYLTNLVGIVLAAVLTFLFLGYSPFHRARRGLALTFLLVLVLSIPLALSFSHMVQEGRIKQELEGIVLNDIQLRHVQVRPGKPTKVSLTLVSTGTIDEQQMDAIKVLIEQKLEQDIQLEVGTRVVR